MTAHTMTVFPAPAGMNRIKTDSFAQPSGVPRARGDEPLIAGTTPKIKSCSPRPRG